MAAYLATGSSMSTRSIFQPCGTNTPNFVDRAMLSPSFSNDRIADAKGRAIDNHGGRARARRRGITLFLYVASHECVAHHGDPGNHDILVTPQGRPSLSPRTPSSAGPDTNCLERRTVLIGVNAWRCRREIA